MTQNKYTYQKKVSRRNPVFVVCNPPCIATEYDADAHNDNNDTEWVLGDLMK